MMRVLVVDNYDSFTFNLVQMIEARGASCRVVRCDEMPAAEALAWRPDRIVLSPGPFGPARTGMCPELVAMGVEAAPILGVCLGMQVIAVAGGARVVPSGYPVHGKSRQVDHDGSGVLRGISSPLRAGLYHSLVVEPETIDPTRLEVFATGREHGTVMGVRLRPGTAEGLLFHPESFLTEAGERIVANFLDGPAEQLRVE